MIALISSSCESPGEGSDVGDERPGNGAGDCGFEILCQPTTATEPRESTFHDPSARQNFEAVRRAKRLMISIVHTDTLQSLSQFISGIATIGKEWRSQG